MLSALSIQNIVLVETLHLDLQKGLSVLTGETGAGKSILLDALGLVVGGRGDSSLVRNGTNKATIIAIFDVEKKHSVYKVLNDLDIDCDVGEDIILKRTVTNEGKSKATVNGAPVTIKELRLVGDCLVDVQGQFDQHGLLNPAQHMNILDNFAGTNTLRNTVQIAYNAWHKANAQYNVALSNFKKAQDDAEYITHCLNELEALDPKIGEETSLLEAKSKLQNAGKLLQTYQSCNTLLGGENGADTALRKTERLLEGISNYAGNEVDEILTTLTDMGENLQNILSSLEEQAYSISASAHDLSSIEDRLYSLNDLARKHRVDIDGLVGVMQDLQKQHSLLKDSDGTLSALKEIEEKSARDYTKSATELSNIRKTASIKLAQTVCSEMPTLGLNGSEFLVSIDTLSDISLNNASQNGIDTIRFMARMNAGAKHSPIHKSASGGELSRMLLAINVALAETNTAVTLMFDEIDAGVGGKSAKAIGGRLKELSKSHQVFVITHSPQVAGSGDNHLFVSKSDINGATISTIQSLSIDERTNEIARMLSGTDVTAEAIANAKTLLENTHA